MKNTSSKYKHLFFDLDHTLWDFELNAGETLSDIYILNKLEERGVNDFDLFIKQYCFHNDRLWERYTRGHIKQEELRWKRMWLTLLEFKIADEPLAKKMSVEFLDRLPFKKNVFPYTIEILEYLRHKNYVLHLITNGFEAIQQSKLQTSKLEKYFAEVITSETSMSLKPNKEIFEFAMARAKANVEESIMIGDNLEADIQGGMNAGMDTVFVNHLRKKHTMKPSFEIFHLQELENIF